MGWALYREDTLHYTVFIYSIFVVGWHSVSPTRNISGVKKTFQIELTGCKTVTLLSQLARYASQEYEINMNSELIGECGLVFIPTWIYVSIASKGF